jgi:hypothetical protein
MKSGSASSARTSAFAAEPTPDTAFAPFIRRPCTTSSCARLMIQTRVSRGMPRRFKRLVDIDVAELID